MSDVVILIHGLGRTSRSMRAMAKSLSRGGFATELFDYHSRHDDVAQIVQQLHQSVLRLLHQHHTVHFVTHSLGGIILRNYLAQYGQSAHIGQTVMLAPPHKGSEIIDFWRRGSLRRRFFMAIMGDTAMSLHTAPDSLPNRLPLLHTFNIGIIAGTRSVEFWFNHLFDSAHDGKVSVASTHLHKNHDYFKVHTTHTFITNHAEVHKQTLLFLQTAHFAT